MRSYGPLKRQMARRITILCAVYFVAFAFSYLYGFQRDLLEQTQYLLSEGTTVYHPLLAAILCTLSALLLGLFLSRMLSWLPLQLKTLAWFPSLLFIGCLTHWHFPAYGDTEQSSGWTLPGVLLAIYGFCLFVAYRFSVSQKKAMPFATILGWNAFWMILLMLACLSVSNTDAVLHHTLRSAHCLNMGDDEGALHAAKWERHPSRTLSVMTALALSRTGSLGDRLFAYPQPYGSKGLMPLMRDTALFYNLPMAVGRHLGYAKSDRTPITFFLELTDTMPKSTPSVRDYRLCAYLLDRRLDRFADYLLQGDTLSADLPVHYREAWLLCQRLMPEAVTDSLHDDSLASRFKEFQTLLHESGTEKEREFRCRDHFGTTYWTYFYFKD